MFCLITEDYGMKKKYSTYKNYHHLPFEADAGAFATLARLYY